MFIKFLILLDIVHHCVSFHTNLSTALVNNHEQCKHMNDLSCRACVTLNRTDQQQYQYCEKASYCFAANYTKSCLAYCGDTVISSLEECKRLDQITIIFSIIYILLLIICPLALLITCVYICFLRCRALLFHKIHADVDDPVQLIPVHNAAPSIYSDVVHPTTAVLLDRGDLDNNFIYAQAEIESVSRKNKAKVYASYDLHTV